ncbi:hypothetical protein [Wolbachia endosymbiont of Nilaparvata lugens]|uniref:hypothetical protein n=1 Tax=Wolbachia endosymbiont of Nilaparvata lugens TaxID=357143 RepID=UPI00117D7FBE|nr:hypothetical protein [Wolbachia endosymbiont of Nilaparvata lugens]
MILFLAFMVVFFGYSEFTRYATLSVLAEAFCGAVVVGIVIVIGACFMEVFYTVKPTVQIIMSVIAVSGVFLGIPLAYYGHRKEKLWKLQKDWEIEKREKELGIWKEKT